MRIGNINQTQSFQGLWGGRTIIDKTNDHNHKYKEIFYEYHPFKDELLKHWDTFDNAHRKLPRKVSIMIPVYADEFDEFYRMDVKENLTFTQEEFEDYKKGTLQDNAKKEVIKRHLSALSEEPFIPEKPEV